MVELGQQRRESGFDVEEVDDEPAVRVHRPFEAQLHAIGMAVHPEAAVGFRHPGEPVRRLEGEDLGDFHVGRYGMPMILWVCRLSCQRGWDRQ